METEQWNIPVSLTSTDAPDSSSTCDTSRPSPPVSAPFIYTTQAARVLVATGRITAPAPSWITLSMPPTRGVGTAGSLAPAMLQPRGESIFSPPQYFPTFLHAVPLTFTLSLYCRLQWKRHTQAYPTHKACLCHKQHGKLLHVLWQAAINKNSANA